MFSVPQRGGMVVLCLRPQQGGDRQAWHPHSCHEASFAGSGSDHEWQLPLHSLISTLQQDVHNQVILIHFGGSDGIQRNPVNCPFQH